MLPLLTRDLISDAERPRTFVLRAVVAGVLLALSLGWLRVPAERLARGDLTALGAGGAAFDAIVMGAFLMVYLLVPALTAPVIAAERERRTLDLLHLTRLSPLVLLLQLLLSRLALLSACLAAALPLCAFVVAFGGVDTRKLVGAAGCLLLAGAQVGSFGLAASVRATSLRDAVVAGYVRGFIMLGLVPGLVLAVPALVLGGMAGPAAGWGLWAGAYPFAMYASLNSGMIDQPMFWLTASFSGLGVCALLLREAAREFTATRAVVPPPHPVTLRPDARWWTPWWYRLAARLGNVLPTIDSDPLAWRDVGRGGRTVNLGFLAIGPFTGCLVLPIVGMLTIGGVGLLATLIQNHSLAPIVAGACHVALAALVMINAATCLGRERATGAMPLLLVTPLSSASILRSKMRAAMLLWRPLVMLAVVLVTVLSVFRRGDAGTEYGDLIVPAVSLVLGTGLTAWIGLGIGARASHPAAAIPSSILVLLGWLALPLVLAPIAENSLPADLVGLIRWCSPLWQQWEAGLVFTGRADTTPAWAALSVLACEALLWYAVRRRALTMADQWLGRVG